MKKINKRRLQGQYVVFNDIRFRPWNNNPPKEESRESGANSGQTVRDFLTAEVTRCQTAVVLRDFILFSFLFFRSFILECGREQFLINKVRPDAKTKKKFRPKVAKCEIISQSDKHRLWCKVEALPQCERVIKPWSWIARHFGKHRLESALLNICCTRFYLLLL